MRRILVLAPPEDHADRAVSLAADIAARRDVEVYLVRVLEESLQPLPEHTDAEAAERLRNVLVESEVRALEELAGPLRRRARTLTESVSWGVPWEVVLGLVERLSIDLVVKPARGMSHEGGVFFGATALHLFRRCPCPVWVVGDHGKLPQRILAAIDPGADGTRQRLASRILGWSQWIATLSGAELHVVSCWHAPAALALAGRVAPAELHRYVESVRSLAVVGQERVLEQAVPPLPEERVHLIQGDPRNRLPHFVDDQAFELVVMGTLGREGLAGELLGETAELVVRAVRSSVVTVSPRSGPASWSRGPALSQPASGPT